MKIYLTDAQLKKNVFINFKIESTVSPSNLHVVFFCDPISCGLNNGNQSDLFVHYFFKKVTHIAYGTTTVDNLIHDLTVGFYLDSNEIRSFIIKDECEEGIRFMTDCDHGEQVYDSFRLFDYTEYTETTKLLGVETLPFNQFISKIINSDLSHGQYSLYNINPQKTITFETLVDQKKFIEFLEIEEVRKADHSLN